MSYVSSSLLLVILLLQDLPNAMSADQITSGLELDKISSHPWHVQPTCATTGEGLDEGFDWLAERIKEKRK